MNDWPTPTNGGDGCCSIGLRCRFDLCLEYNDEMLAVFQLLHTHKGTSFNFQGFYSCSIPATTGPVETPTLPSSRSTGQVVPTCASHKCQPKDINQKNQGLRISHRIPGTQAARRPKIDEIAVKLQTEEDWEGKDRKRRLRRLRCVVMALVVKTVVMFVF